MFLRRWKRMVARLEGVGGRGWELAWRRLKPKDEEDSWLVFGFGEFGGGRADRRHATLR